jgi:hypothetical protein
MLRLAALILACAFAVIIVALASAQTGTGRVVVHAELRPSVGVPRPAGATHARGSLSASFPRSSTRPRFLWTILFFNLKGPATEADLQVGPSDVADRRLFTLCMPCRAGRSGDTNLTNRGVRLIESGRVYVVVRTAANTRGEIRGRLLISR